MNPNEVIHPEPPPPKRSSKTLWVIGVIGGIDAVAFLLIVVMVIILVKTRQTSAPSSPNSSSAQANSGPCSIATPAEISNATGHTVTVAKPFLPDGPNGCEYIGDTWVQVMIYNQPDFDQRQASQCTSGSQPVPDISTDAVDCGHELYVRIDAERGFVVACASSMGGDARAGVGRLIAPRVAAMH